MFSSSLQLHADQPIQYRSSHTLHQSHPKKIREKHFRTQNCGCFKWPEILTSQEQVALLDNGKMCLITDIQTHNSPHLV